MGAFRYAGFELLQRLDRTDEAVAAFERAKALTTNGAELELLERLQTAARS